MIALSFAALAAVAATPEVWKHWSDGQAELSGYRLVQPRYGQLRTGHAVLIFVTEPFSESARVKADPGQHPDSDVFNAMKLNLVKDFQTGIYDYNLMTSVFVQMEARKGERAGAAVKLTFSSQEWCGNLFEELLVDPSKITQRRFSYFDGEGDRIGSVDKPKGALLFEELFFVVRSLPEPLLGPGASRTITMHGSLERSRLLHRPASFGPATITRGAGAAEREVPAGRFTVETWTVEGEGGRYTFWVERAFPNRLVAWEGPDGEKAELTGSRRLKYWELNQEGGERHLHDLGLPRPRPAG